MSYQKTDYKPVESSASGNDQNGNGTNSTEGWKKWLYGVSAAVIVVMIGAGISKTKTETQVESASKPEEVKMELFDEHGRFVLEDYDSKPAFSSFLPAVAGLYGKPVWAYYVNRGQGMATFGTVSKEYPILEFNAANKAYQSTPYLGFRTFIQGRRGEESFLTEPFTPKNSRVKGDEVGNSNLPKRVMYTSLNHYEVAESDDNLGLKTTATFFVLPEEDFGALVRRMTITNTGDDTLTISALDGLGKIEPVGGMIDWSLKNMGRTLEGWFGVYHADDTLNLPFFRMSTEADDSAEVVIEQAGHYCISFIEGDENTPLPIVYDGKSIFGQDTSLMEPNGLKTKTISEILSNPQYGDAITSSSFAALENFELGAGESITISSFYGKAVHVEEVPKIAKYVMAPGYASSKFLQAQRMINRMTSGVETTTASPLFDGAVRQMYLDNSLRGGMPFILGDVDESAKMSNYDEDSRVKVFHTFSRIHGDLERDYNAFDIAYTYFSQGPGNYRDIAQNRREDVTFLPRMGAFNVKQFLSYIQADGYEPMTVEAVVYMVTDEEKIATIASSTTADAQSAQILTDILKGGTFRPGQMFDLVEQLGINLSVENDDFLDQVVAAAESIPMAVYGEGYWADHWEYYLDLIESYLAIYPDGEEELMYDNKMRYFFSTATVKPRSEKYVLTYTYDASSKHVLQLDATVFDTDKVAEQDAFRIENTGILGIDAYWQRTAGGAAFESTPIAKLFLLGSMKYATRDAYGMGVEYEGGRPGWNDAMNGLPGMVGSGMPETYEMYLMLQYVKKVVDKYQRPLVIPAELDNMISTVNGALDDLDASGYTDAEDLLFDVPEELFNYWDAVATARENYRKSITYYFSGDTTELSADAVSSILGRWMTQVEVGMARALKFGSHGFEDDGTSGIPASYFSYDITKWELNGLKHSDGLPLVDAKAMKVGRFPLFLEGPVRYMKTITTDKAGLQDMYQRVYTSGLRDEKLKMYKLSGDLTGQSYDMGRMMAFTPGWLENGSVWMHMMYKYYLELIRGGLFEEFFSEMKGGGMLPFMDPDVYGRSLMECSSFIASSAFPDPETQGRGFSARLSGSTAEFLSMWKLMFVGPEPFYVGEDGEVKMQLVPALPMWLFEDEDSESTVDDDGNATVNFKLFASISVTYHNSLNDNLYRVLPKSYEIKFDDGSVENVSGAEIPTNLATKIRKLVGVASIDAYF